MAMRLQKKENRYGVSGWRLLKLRTGAPGEHPDWFNRRWPIGVSRQGHMAQPVRDRPRPKDSGRVAWEAPWRESKTGEPSGNILRKEYAQRTKLQYKVNADVATLHEIPVAAGY